VTTEPKKKRGPRKPDVPIEKRLCWTIAETCAVIGGGTSENYVAALEARQEFPPRYRLPSMKPGDAGRKCVFVAREVRAWIEGRDWRAMVDERLGQEQKRGA